MIRLYIATRDDCEACEITKNVLGIKNSFGTVSGADIHEVDLSANPERANQMGVSSVPTIFIVDVEDDNHNNILEEIEEKHLWHQSGIIVDKTNLEMYVERLRKGFILKTNL